MAARAAISVARARVTAGGLDPLTARLRLEALLGAAELRPRGLSPAAILCVQRLTDPRPGTLRLRDVAFVPPPAWAEAAREALERLARDAARPVHGAVPAGAAAVVFADEGEALACLAIDVARGVAAERWWWAALHGDDPAAALRRELRRVPEAVPVALERVTAEGLAGPVLRTFSPGEARAVRAEVSARFGVPLAPTAHGAGAAGPTAQATPRTSEGAAERDRGRALIATVVPELSTLDAGREEALLLVTAVAIRRAPQLARSDAFARAVDAWSGDGVPSLRAGERRLASTSVAPRAANTTVLEHEGTPAPPDAPPLLVAPVIARLEGAEPRRDPAPDSAASPARPRRVAIVRGTSEVPADRREQGPSGPDAPAVSPARGPDVRPPTPPARADAREDREPAFAPGAATDPPAPVLADPTETHLRAPVEAVVTELGGVFYLIYVALALGLYGDFSAPRAPGLALPFWDFIPLLARRLLGGAVPEDPIWPVLARLTGRAPDDEPGAGFEPPSRFHAPPPWAGECDPEWRADGRSGPAALAAFLDHVATLVRRHLTRVLVLADPDDLAPVLLLHRARVFVTNTRVDVAFSLAAHPIAIRLAGLDRDPGWIPSAGRDVRFHFD